MSSYHSKRISNIKNHKTEFTHSLPFLQFDAFTDRVLAGNPCAVVFEANDLTDSQMLQIAKEMNLSETVFVLDPDQSDYKARYFTPCEEIPLAGHPTIALFFALFEKGLIKKVDGLSKHSLELPAGILEIELKIEHGQLTRVGMNQLPPEFLNTYSAREIAPIFSLKPDDLIEDVPVQTVSTGTPQLMIPLISLDALKRARLKVDDYISLKESGDFFSPHLFILEGFTSRGHTFARHFGVPPDTLEDPFTGSATGNMACYLFRYDLLPCNPFQAEQGHLMGRPGEALVQLTGTPENIEKVMISGKAVKILSGEIFPDL